MRDGERIVQARIVNVYRFRTHPDVAVFVADQAARPFGQLLHEPAWPFTDIWSIGYPEDAMVDDRPEGGFQVISGRVLKGHVARWMERGELPAISGPSFELSFPVPSGMSGSPIANQW